MNECKTFCVKKRVFVFLLFNVPCDIFTYFLYFEFLLFVHWNLAETALLLYYVSIFRFYELRKCVIELLFHIIQRYSRLLNWLIRTFCNSTMLTLSMQHCYSKKKIFFFSRMERFIWFNWRHVFWNTDDQFNFHSRKDPWDCDMHKLRRIKNCI